MIDPDEFWFSPKYGTLERLLAHKHAEGYVGVGQAALIFGPGPVTGSCADLPPVLSSHLWRRASNGRGETWAKFPWVRVDRVDKERMAVHEHLFPLDCPDKGAHYCKGPKWSATNKKIFNKPRPACCEMIAHAPTIEELRMHHYAFKSELCSQEKAVRNGNIWAAISGNKTKHYSAICDPTILPYTPDKYKTATLPFTTGR
uniref:Glycosyltransferase family 92 protein n=2 Tax=Chrysotila carterae TaxID=13221 RepID=A0A7S4B378_CHRCT